ncbi:hypothetical protein M595_0018 [Lyngbya aestuarii BL J]|uniref:Uncharacterized protein n=1 Tax=Lyngbya aestuarii BL J TaxID=1348334 RepID=U7QPJ7_9CYAN|nr:hypothetical protein [Lyngbya aestuarii]ERT09808.1 hypothetical protein M595_0018 [Lyngbya aestuarii BL J]
MAQGSFATMQAEPTATQLTFYYENGQAETLSVPIMANELGPILQKMLNQPWLTFNLPEQTVMISTQKVIKVEIKPALTQLQGEGIFSNTQRVTALQRGAAGRLGI